MKEINLNNNINKYLKGSTKFMLSAILACSFSQGLNNESKLLQENMTNIAAENEKDEQDRLQKAQKIMNKYQQNITNIKGHTISFATTKKLQIVKIKNNTKNTFNYHIIGTVSDINKETDQLEYLLIDMISLKPLYKLDENKEIVGETDKISYTEEAILSDYLMQLGHIKERYKSTELDQIITFINNYKKTKPNALKK